MSGLVHCDDAGVAPGAWLDDTERRSNLTRSQFLIWLGQKIDPAAPLYNMIFAFRLRGPLDAALLERAFEALVAESEILRSVIDEVDGVPQRRVLDRLAPALERVALTHQTLTPWLEHRKLRRFEAGQPLFDSALVRLADDDHLWYLNQHHIVTDAWSTSLLLRRLGEHYAGDGGSLPAFADYATRERARRNEPRQQRARDYWHDAMTRPSERLSFYGQAGAAVSVRTERRRCPIGRERTQALRAIAAEPGVRMFNAQLSLFRAVATVVLAWLHRLSGASRLALGAPVHNRATPTDRATPGLYTEVFPLYADFDRGETLGSLLGKTAAGITGLFANASPGVSSPETNNAYEVLLNFLTMRMPGLPGVETTTDWIHSGFGDSAHKLRLQVHDFDNSGELCFDFDFNRSSFDADAEQLAIDQFFAVLDAFIADREQVIAALDIARPAERQRQVLDFNDTAATFPAATVLEAFAAQVRRAPDALALRSEDGTLSYAGLDLRSDALALRLAQAGLAAGKVAALAMPRSTEAVIAILAVLKTGAAYLPLDIRHPPARLRAILEDVAASELDMHSVIGHGPRRDWSAAAAHWIDPGDTAAAPAGGTELIAPGPGDLAYIIYTSGSTGTPKGVQIEHRSLANYVAWARGQYCGDERLTFAVHTSLAVDLTVTSVYVPLTSGGSAIVYPDLSDNDLPVIRVFERDEVDVLKLTPAHLALIREIGGRAERIRTLILGGEDLKTGPVRATARQFPDTLAVYNEYGPTEGTVGCMIHRYDPGVDTTGSVGIGHPIANAGIYVLDERAQPVPTGLIDEICIGGIGVARGYLNRPALDAERFVHCEAAGGRVYRTGDLGRWDVAGRLHYLGRGDEQVKVRGMRIELAEVEAALRRDPAVQRALVVALTAGEHHELRHCRRCGMPSNYPGIMFDDAEVCSMCLSFELFRDQAMAYFGDMDQLAEIAAQIRAETSGAHDCIVLLSGGKDSTYMIHQVVALGLRPLALTLDNGFISEGALANVRRTVEALGIDHVVATTPHMNAIFADSLARYSNVCHGCFKTIYTLALREARARGIGYIFTGLSRGQIFETRLNDLFRHRIFDVAEIERAIVEARKVYHRVEDAVAHALDFDLFGDDRIFDEVRFVDFYRYCDVELDEVYGFLSERAPWVRPTDTGRSTNCLINDAGIYVHRKERGYHNYALPYSWDVRLGHKTRAAALYELDDEIDMRRVRRILEEVGYGEKPARGDTRLVAYYTGEPVSGAELRSRLAETLPDEMLPDAYVHLDEWPLNATGKIDRAALPPPADHREARATEFVAPSSDVEKRLAAIWSQLLETARIGSRDNFFDLGGVSLAAIQSIARIRESFGVELPVQSFFRAPTIAAIAREIEERIVAEIAAMPDEEVERLLDGDSRE